MAVYDGTDINGNASFPYWTAGTHGAVKVIGNTALYKKPNTKEINHKETIVRGNYMRVTKVEQNEHGTFYKTQKGWIRESNQVKYYDSSQLGADHMPQGLFSMNNIIVVGLIFVLYQVGTGAFEWIGKKV